MNTVLITGASQGSGRATALLFARQGYNVVLAARQPDRLEQTAEEVRSLGVSALAISTDVGNMQQVQTLVDRSLEFCGSIDVLVNNAGICLTGPIEKTTLEDWQQILNTNLWGYIHTIQAILPHFLQQKSGTIVNVGSFGGKMPLPGMTAYCTSKYAVTGLTETLRLELAGKGIHVCAVHPGIINSNFLERAQFRGNHESELEQQRQQMNAALKSAIVSQPEDIANAIWDVVRKQQPEVVVGPALFATEAHRLFPGLIQFLFKKR
ncbi:MAG: SDR family NAD(P)-dependent oxidoreductase [Microcoleaceae cyanobacterium]